MTTYNKTTLKTVFETGDIPGGSDYANLIDSYVNIVETANQSMAGPLTTTELVTPKVSAANAVISNALTVNGAAVFGSDVEIDGTLSLTGAISTGTLDGATITGSIINATTQTATNFTGINVYSTSDLNAFNVHVSGAVTGISSKGGLQIASDVSATSNTIYVSALKVSNGIVSAAGTAQATAAALVYTANIGKGVVDGSTTGFALPANAPGRVQYLFNTGASANLWPPTGGTINSLAANAVFPLAASALYTIVHIGASAYAVK